MLKKTVIYILCLLLVWCPNSVLPKFIDKLEDIDFYFEQKKLSDIINLIAQKRKINIIPPQLASDAEVFNNQLITYKPKDKAITLEKAWELTLMFLEFSGFSLFQKKENIYAIIPIGKPDEKGISRQALDLYVDVNIEDLPDSQERIRYIYYLKNLLVTDEQNNPLTQIIKDMSSEGAPAPVFLKNNNGLLIVDKANIIASVINLISRLDETGFHEVIEIVPIYNIPAQEVAKILDLLKKAAEPKKEQLNFIRADDKPDLKYFAADLQIVPDTRNNTLIIMGRQTAVDRIINFINNHVDILPESGKSILHYYDLQYLKAKEFEPVLQEIVKSEIKGSQATQAASEGPLRFFKGVVVKAEEELQLKTIPSSLAVQPNTSNKIANFEPKGLQGQAFSGGNRIIVAALEDDWIEIKKLIEKLDKPRPQVIFEVVIADIVIDDLIRLAGTTRSKTFSSLPGGDDFQFLSSNITPVSNVLGPNPQQLAQDLLGVIGTSSLPAQLQPGSLLISFNDPATPGIWALIQVLNQFVKTNVSSHPFVVTTDNQKADISQELQRRNRGDVVPGPNGSFIIPIENITATIKLSMVPSIASLERLKLSVAVRIEDFIGTTLNKITRGLNTTVTMASNQILAVGGLNRTDHRDVFTKTPILGDIPIIGTLFSGNQLRLVKTSIIIFIKPTIVMPKESKEAAAYTEDKLDMALVGTDNSEIYDFRSPIVRLFLSEPGANTDLVQEYLDQTSNLDKEQNTNFNKLISNHKLPKPNQNRININKLKQKLYNQENPVLGIKKTKR